MHDSTPGMGPKHVREILMRNRILRVDDEGPQRKADPPIKNTLQITSTLIEKSEVLEMVLFTGKSDLLKGPSISVVWAMGYSALSGNK